MVCVVFSHATLPQATALAFSVPVIALFRLIKTSTPKKTITDLEPDLDAELNQRPASDRVPPPFPRMLAHLQVALVAPIDAKAQLSLWVTAPTS